MDKSSITVEAERQAAESLVATIEALAEGNSLNALELGNQELARRQFLLNRRKHGAAFAKAVRAERRKMLFVELGENPAQQSFIDEMLPASGKAVRA